MPNKLLFNLPGWTGYAFGALIGTTLFIYAFLPTVGGVYGCVTVTPLFCLSAYMVFHLPLGIAGFFAVSHLFPKHNVRILLILLMSTLGFLALPPHVHAQPVPVAFLVTDYYPYTFWTDKPQNVSYATAFLDEYYVFEWAYFWNYHPPSFPSTCASITPSYDWELVYVYVSYTTQNVAGVAYRYHCQWTFVSQTDPLGIVAIQVPGSISINATRPVVTFIGKYHVPVNDYPYGTRYKADISTGAIEFLGSFGYTQTDYNYTALPALNPDARPIDPGFFRNFNWPNVAIFTIGGFVVTGASIFIFATEKKKLAGF